MANVHVGTSSISERESLDLPFGKDPENDADLKADGNNDHHDGPGKLLLRHGPRKSLIRKESLVVTESSRVELCTRNEIFAPEMDVS